MTTPELHTDPATPAERAAIVQATLRYLSGTGVPGHAASSNDILAALQDPDISDIEIMVADQGLLAVAYSADHRQHTVIIYTRDHGAASSPWRVLTLQTRQHTERP